MKRAAIHTIAVLTLAVATGFESSSKDLIVVANTSSANIVVEKRQVRDMFMGNNVGSPFKPLALAPKSEIRSVFNTKVVGLTESRIQSYWAQMRFSGRSKPPQEFDSVESVLQYMQHNEETVAYLPAETEIPAGFTVIYKTQ